jgi:hypothetical protein
LPESVCCLAHDFISKTGARMPDAQLMVLPQAVFFQKMQPISPIIRAQISPFSRERTVSIM